MRRQTGTAVVPCPRHEYRLLEDGRTLLGPAETRWKVCNYRYTSQWKMSLKNKYQHIKLLHIYHMDLQKPIQARTPVKSLSVGCCCRHHLILWDLDSIKHEIKPSHREWLVCSSTVPDLQPDVTPRRETTCELPDPPSVNTYLSSSFP